MLSRTKSLYTFGVFGGLFAAEMNQYHGFLLSHATSSVACKFQNIVSSWLLWLLCSPSQKHAKVSRTRVKLARVFVGDISNIHSCHVFIRLLVGFEVFHCGKYCRVAACEFIRDALGHNFPES